MSQTHWTSPDIETSIVNLYNQLPYRIEDLPAKDLVRSIEWRIYTEWCCNREESNWDDHMSYRGQAFYGWLNKETHYALERAGFEWDSNQRQFVADNNFSQAYATTREQVLRAAVVRSVEFFRNCKQYRWPSEGDKGNLRVSLESYITQK